MSPPSAKRTFSRHSLSIQPEPNIPYPDDVGNGKRRKPSPPSPIDSQYESQPVNGGGGGPKSRKERKDNRARDMKQNDTRKSFSGPISLPESDGEVVMGEAGKEDVFSGPLALAKSKNIQQDTHQGISLYGGGRNALSSYSVMMKTKNREDLMKKTQADGSVNVFMRGGITSGPDADDKIETQESHAIVGEESDAIDIDDTIRNANKLAAAEGSARLFDGREYVSAQTPAHQKTLWGKPIKADSVQALGWNRNQVNSPLLRLPATVRRRIFEYTLDGNHIKFGFCASARTKTLDGKPKTLSALLKYDSTVYDGPCNPLIVKKPRGISVTVGMTLLNGVCRQLYYETYILPYKLNVFYFDSGNTLLNFIVMEERLLPQQCKAITELSIRNHLPAPAVLHALPKLQRVYLVDPVFKEEEPAGWYQVMRYDNKIELKKEVGGMRGGANAGGHYGASSGVSGSRLRYRVNRPR